MVHHHAVELLLDASAEDDDVHGIVARTFDTPEVGRRSMRRHRARHREHRRSDLQFPRDRRTAQARDTWLDEHELSVGNGAPPRVGTRHRQSVRVTLVGPTHARQWHESMMCSGPTLYLVEVHVHMWVDRSSRGTRKDVEFARDPQRIDIRNVQGSSQRAIGTAGSRQMISPPRAVRSGSATGPKT